MNPFNPYSSMMGMGFSGLALLVVFWFIATLVTGYVLGLGIWLAMPGRLKRLIRIYSTQPPQPPSA